MTSIATTSDNSETILSSSRDKKVIVWKLTRDEQEFGYAHKALVGHAHHVEDVVISIDGQFALSASWDHTLRLWDLTTGETTRTFTGHTKDVLSVAFSTDNRQIISGSRDRSIKLWNTLGECRHTFADAHGDWVSCVRFSPNSDYPIIVSGGWDKAVKVWDLTRCQLKFTLTGHSGYVNAITIAPDGSLCASGGKDGHAILWDLNEGRELYRLDAGSIINTLCFSPNRYWLCAGTDAGIKIFDLESKALLADLTKNYADFGPKNSKAACISLAWSVDGTTLFAGYTDSVIRVWSTGSSLQ